MKKIILFMVSAVCLLLTACDPIEDREELKSGISADQLKISATPEIRDGVNSNYVRVVSDGNPCLSSWDYGSGTYIGTDGIVQLLLEGENDIVYTGLNGDGSKITKTLTVRVDKLFDVASEWGYFCGTGEKEWVWDETSPDGVWGNGGYLANTAPGWWKVQIGEMEGQTPGEGANASMLFAIKGSALTKKKSDGSTVKGTFTFDMTKQKLNANGDANWSIGKLTTKNVTALSGKQSNGGNAPIYDYDILQLDDDKMVLSWPEPGAGAWGTAWFWMFRAK